MRTSLKLRQIRDESRKVRGRFIKIIKGSRKFAKVRQLHESSPRLKKFWEIFFEVRRRSLFRRTKVCFDEQTQLRERFFLRRNKLLTKFFSCPVPSAGGAKLFRFQRGEKQFSLTTRPPRRTGDEQICRFSQKSGSLLRKVGKSRRCNSSVVITASSPARYCSKSAALRVANDQLLVSCCKTKEPRIFALDIFRKNGRCVRPRVGLRYHGQLLCRLSGPPYHTKMERFPTTNEVLAPPFEYGFLFSCSTSTREKMISGSNRSAQKTGKSIDFLNVKLRDFFVEFRFKIAFFDLWAAGERFADHPAHDLIGGFLIAQGQSIPKGHGNQKSFCPRVEELGNIYVH